MPKTHDTIHRTAREEFGYERLRGGQEVAIQSLLDGRDTLAVMPTGSGKSAIYQIAGQLLDGPVVVISPLIALQYDQVQSIKEHDVDDAMVINSTQSETERREAFERLRNSSLKYLFMAPEQFNNAEVLDQMQIAHPSLFVVDEAHCISEWGHDFRPEYLRLGEVIEALGHPRVLALTATAAPPVREEILERLGMRHARVIVRGFDRPNIWLGVERFETEQSKLRALLERIEESEKPGIIYAATRRHAQDVAQALQERDISAVHYHAGLTTAERERTHEAFMADEKDVIVATTAFGMGVDKPNVRFVFHYDISDSIDSYYQEIGRAGRDGEPARAVLFYRTQDLSVQRFLTGGGRVNADQVTLVATVVQKHSESVDPEVLIEETGLGRTLVMTALNRLEEIGVVEILPTGEAVWDETPTQLSEVAEEAALAQERYLRFGQSRIEMMQGYAEVNDCRREYLLNYFGEETDGPCGYCDNCDAGRTVKDSEATKLFPINSRVVHRSLGEGLVQRYEGDKIVVLFDDVGYRTLALDIISENHLLEVAQ